MFRSFFNILVGGASGVLCPRLHDLSSAGPPVRRTMIRNQAIPFRVSEEEKHLVFKAASLRGYTVSDFVRETVLREARNVTADQEGRHTDGPQSEGQG